MNHSAEEMSYIGETIVHWTFLQRRILTMYSTAALAEDNNMIPKV
jgi:hypothetical protein